MSPYRKQGEVDNYLSEGQIISILNFRSMKDKAVEIVTDWFHAIFNKSLVYEGSLDTLTLVALVETIDTPTSIFDDDPERIDNLVMVYCLLSSHLGVSFGPKEVTAMRWLMEQGEELAGDADLLCAIAELL